MKTLTRRDPRNAMLEHIRLDRAESSATVIVDQGHPFFYDHPLDHVPGLLLIEAALQLGRNWMVQIGCHRWRLCLLGVRFEKYCLHSHPIRLHLSPIILGIRQIKAEIIISQQGCARARLRISFSKNYPVPEPAAYPVASETPDHPDGIRLNKHSSDNIMIATPQRLPEGWVTRLLSAPEENLLSDPPEARYWHPLYLLEGYMQLLRFRNSDPEGSSLAGRMRDILCGIELEILAPVARGEPVALLSVHQQSEDARYWRTKGQIFTDHNIKARVQVLTARARSRLINETTNTAQA